MKNLKYFLAGILGTFAAVGLATSFDEARIYINPGHGGWGSNDRNLQTINHAMGDTTGFYETNTNLLKCLELYHDLEDFGAAEVMLSRTKNGISDDCEIDGVPQLVTLSVICEDVEANNIDYFISVHSNAASEGSTTNYPLVLYRGTDDAVGNGLVDAKNMGIAAWPFINDNGITFKSHYTKPTDCNVRGDMTFMGGSSTTMGYTGYYGVLRHGADGYLIEGCFHTYQPERHRLLNPDYCHQEGMRYARAIRSWFNGPQETTGDIMGTVKNANHPLENALYKYKAASMDAYAPLNETVVVLKNAAGEKVAEYTTDDEYNGVFVFEDLEPGVYTIDFTDQDVYHPYSEEIEVVANKTVFTNILLTSINEELLEEEPEAPEVEYYTHPEQEGDIMAASSYTFSQAGEIASIPALEGLNVRRTILRDNKYYILAHNDAREPHLLVVNPETGELIKEMSLEGLVTEGFNGKQMSWTLSDIAFTNDGVLIGTNSVVIGRENNGYCNGDFYMYAWKGDDTTPLEEQKPTVVYTMKTNVTDNVAAAGNNYSNLMSNSFAINGNFDEFNYYFDSHAGDAWTTTYGLRYVCWTMKNGVPVNTQWNDANSSYDETMFGEDAMMTLSPLGLNRIVVDGSKISSKEFEVDMLANEAHDMPNFEDVNIETSGANYFRYADDIFMVTPVYDNNSYGLRLYNVTDGFDKAELLAEYPALITTDALKPMWAYGNVRNADIDLYLMVGNQTAKVTTEGNEIPTETARVYAYDLKQEKGEDAYTLTFSTNLPSPEATVKVINKATGKVEFTAPATNVEDGRFTATVNKADIAENTEYTWEVEVAADNVTRFFRNSADNKDLEFYCPYGVAFDNSPESPYFGRMYVSNTLEGATANNTTGVGLYAYDADGNLINATALDGGVEWTGAQGEGPRRIAVAADGRIFTSDHSKTNTGIYYIDPETFAAKNIFTGAINDGNGSLSIGDAYVGGRINSVGVRGSGENTQLFAVDATKSGASWKKYVNRYDIGEATEWTSEPSYSAVHSSYFGNDNNTIVPISTGFWGAQYRGAGSSSVANPCLFYFSDELGEVVFDSSSFDTAASQNGAMAVDEARQLIAQSYNGGVRVLKYKIKSDGKPEVEVLFELPLEDQGDYSNAMAFDYAGNLYAVSNVSERLTSYAMPTSDNRCVTPASSKMVILFGESSADEIATEATASVYPNPIESMATVNCSEGIQNVAVYNIANGAAVYTANGNGQTEMSIDLSGLAKGVYFVRINNTYTVKIIKR